MKRKKKHIEELRKRRGKSTGNVCDQKRQNQKDLKLDFQVCIENFFRQGSDEQQKQKIVSITKGPRQNALNEEIQHCRGCEMWRKIV